MRINVQDLAVTLSRSHALTPSRTRRGSIAVEIVLVLPIFMILLMGMVEFSMLLNAREQLLAAAQAGARVAAQGGNDQEVRDTVKRVLGGGRINDALVDIERTPEDVNNPTAGRDRVQVVVYTEISHIIPNALAWVGINLAGQRLVAGAVMNLE